MSCLSDTSSPGEPERGQTETIGLILVFGMVLAGAALIVTFGAVAIEDTQGTLSETRAQKAMTQFDSKSALVALGNSQTQSIIVPLRGMENLEVKPGAGTMTIEVNKIGGPTQHNETWSLGAFVFESGEMNIAYQGGGVWRKRGTTNESVMVSPPEFHFRNGTLTLPVITIDGPDSVTERVSVSHKITDSWYPDQSASPPRANPLDNHKVELTVQSEYYKGWGRYFEERTDGEVTYNHSNNEVTIELLTPIGSAKLNAATASLAANGSFKLLGRADTFCGNDAYVNSYNGSNTPDDYCDQAPGNEGPPMDRQPGIEGDVIYGKDVDIDVGTGTSNLYGDLTGGQDVIVSGSSGSGQPDVWGNITYGNNCIVNPGGLCSNRVIKPGATASPGTGIPTAPRINGYVNAMVDDIESDNDNLDPGIPISGAANGSISWSGGTATLEEGRYHLERLSIPGGGSGNTLFLEPNGGEISIAIEDDIHVERRGTIKVQGNGTVKIFIEGEEGSEYDGWDMNLEKQSAITNDGDDAPQFRVIGKDDLQAQIGGGQGGPQKAKYVGVIYAPPDPTGSGLVKIDGGVIYGGVLTGTTTLNKGSVHYDEALKDKQLLDPGAKVIKITYLHVSTNRIDINSG